MRRLLFEPEHDAFREMVRDFVGKEIVPYHPQWERDGIISRDVWRKAGESGMLGFSVDERYGGGGVRDFRYNAIVTEELTRVQASGVGFPLQNDVVEPYLTRLCNEEQAERWLPGFCSGEIITAIAMTEPGTGSDLLGIRTTAVDAGDHYVLNGAKTFITNGILSDLVVVVARTDPEAGARGLSLLVVERGMDGFERGRNLEKIGMHAQDTAELFFNDVKVPKANLLGEAGGGFGYLMNNLPQERLSIAVAAAAGAEAAIEQTVAYCKQRHAFGKPIASFQHIRFELAEMATEARLGRVYVDRCIEEHNAGEFGLEDAAMAKWWATDAMKRIVDRCLQLHGGYGYMREYPIARAYEDARVQTIYGGTNEIMKEIIGRIVTA